MPFYNKININHKATLFLWKIEEPIAYFLDTVALTDASKERLSNMKSEEHKKGFLAIRMLLQELGLHDENLVYDEFGKPHLVERRREKGEGKSPTKNLNPFDFTTFEYHISISHSNDFSGILISKDFTVGLDLEIIKPKILAIAPRFMDVSHLENLNEDQKQIKATVIWGIKESIFKIKNEKGISFPNHITEKPFDISDSTTLGYLNFNNKFETFDINFGIQDDYVFVCAFPKS